MGGTSACCVEREPQNESILKKEAKTNEDRTSVKYKCIDINEQENDSFINIPVTTQTKKRGSIIHIEQNKGETEDKKEDNDDLYDIKQNNFENIKISHDRASRASYDSEEELTSPSKYSKTKTKHSHSHHHKKKHKKSKNKLVSSLRDCIDEFNKSMQSISVLQLMSTRPTINAATSTYDQNELLDKKEIPKYFKEKKYDIQWFLLTKRNKFIKIMVNKWPNNISILTSIKLYDMLQEKISKHTPSVSQSSLNIVSTPYNHYKPKNLNGNKRRKSGHQENIMFTWRDDVNEIDDCDINHFLYIASLVIKNLNQEIMKTNAHSTQTMHKKRPLYHQMDILTYLLEIEMDGYLFRGCSKEVFQINISRFMIDTSNNDDYLNNISMEYSAIFHAKCDQFEISKIYKQSTCTIEFTLSNSKRWESVSSLIKTMQVSEYNVDLAIDNSSSDGDGEDDSSSNSNTHSHPIDDDEKQREPDLLLQGSMNISAQMEKLREMKDTMDTNEYISKMETLQQKLAESLTLK